MTIYRLLQQSASDRPRVKVTYMQEAINNTPSLPKVGLGQVLPADGEVIRMVKGGFLGRGYTVYRTKVQGGVIVSECVLQASLTKKSCQRVFDVL